MTIIDALLPAGTCTPSPSNPATRLQEAQDTVEAKAAALLASLKSEEKSLAARAGAALSAVARGLDERRAAMAAAHERCGARGPLAGAPQPGACRRGVGRQLGCPPPKRRLLPPRLQAQPTTAHLRRPTSLPVPKTLKPLSHRRSYVKDMRAAWDDYNDKFGEVDAIKQVRPPGPLRRPRTPAASLAGCRHALPTAPPSLTSKPGIQPAPLTPNPPLLWAAPTPPRPTHLRSWRLRCPSAARARSGASRRFRRREPRWCLRLRRARRRSSGARASCRSLRRCCASLCDGGVGRRAPRVAGPPLHLHRRATVALHMRDFPRSHFLVCDVCLLSCHIEDLPGVHMRAALRPADDPVRLPTSDKRTACLHAAEPT